MHKPDDEKHEALADGIGDTESGDKPVDQTNQQPAIEINIPAEPAPSDEIVPAVKEIIQHASHDTKDKNHSTQPIIIKRVKKVVHGHHGGAWKIAYADFVTAMMTFFLLMWLLSMLNKFQLQGISDYFKRPITSVVPQQVDPRDNKVKVQETTTTNKTQKNKQVAESSDKNEIENNEENRKASEEIKQDLEKQLNENPKISQYKNMLNFVITSQGLKIELKDLQNKPMFSSGKTDFAEYATTILEWLSTAMNKYPNRVMIVGHTDSNPIQGSLDYTNWELSADRANATRRELISHGMDEHKVVRIVGTADVNKLKTAATNEDPANRRIEIIILNDKTFNKMQDD